MNRIVLDASALLAVLNREPGADKLTPQLLSSATSSTVNLAKVQSKLVARGLSPDNAWEATLSPIREAMAFHRRARQDRRQPYYSHPRTWLVILETGLV
jgi:PIN domain nuclease of toxin-antitoxin system